MALGIITLAILFIYYPVISGHASIMTNSTLGPSGSLFIGDPAAGGEITYFKELAVTQAWSSLHLPVWLPYEGYGITLGGNQAAPWFFPEIIAHVLFPRDISIWNVSALVIAAYGAYFLARKLKINRPGSIAAGLAYALAGPAIANLNLDMINPLAVMPYAVFTGIRLVEALSGKKSVLLWFSANAFVMSQLFLSGFAEVLPLECVAIGFFVLARSFYLGENVRARLRILAIWLLSIAIAVISSLVATLTLLQTLSSYTVFQPPGSSLAHEPRFWMITVFDPWVFGKGLAGGHLELGNTVWAPGNPVLFALAAIGVTAIFTTAKGWQRTWTALATFFVGFGLLGFANLLGVLSLFNLPPFNLIYMPRFLPFLWWLPLVLLVGRGVSRLTDSKKSVLIFGFSAVSTVLALLVWNIIVKGGTIFAIIDNQNLLATLERNFPVLLLTTASFLVILLVPKKQKARVSMLSLLLTLFVMVPKNFFSTYQAPNQAQPLANFLTHHHLNNGLTFSPNDYSLPSGLLGLSIPSIQSFDIFFPRGYGITIEHWFGAANPFSTTSPLYPGAPSLMNELVDSKTLTALRNIGVETLISQSPVSVSSLAIIKVAPEPSYLNVPNAQYSQALTTVLNIYKSRPDLQNAPLSTINTSLFQWALVTKKAGDGAAVYLQPYFPIYSKLLSLQSTHPEQKVYDVTLPSSKLLSTIKYVGTSNFAPVKEYIYDIGGPQNATPLWIPTKFRFFNYSPSTAPIALNGSVANIPLGSKVNLSAQDTMSAHVVDEVENASSLKMTLSVNQSGFVALRRQLVPGETITVNGQRAPLIPVNGFLTGFEIPKGIVQVSINYTSRSLLLLFWLDLVLNAALVSVLLAAWWRSTRKLAIVDLPKL